MTPFARYRSGLCVPRGQWSGLGRLPSAVFGPHDHGHETRTRTVSGMGFGQQALCGEERLFQSPQVISLEHFGLILLL